MDTTSKRMLEAVCCSLRGEKTVWSEIISVGEWMKLFELSQRHHILPMVFETVYQCPAFHSIPGEQVMQLRRQVVMQVVLQSKKSEEFLELYRKMLEEGLTPLVVKGLVCRSLYPEPDYRASGDEDILIPPEQFKACDKILLENGMKRMKSDLSLENEDEISYYKDGGVLHIELHKRLFPKESKAYGNFNMIFDRVFDRKIQQEIQGVPIFTMGYTDHLLYLILHAFKHFMHSGFGIRQVCDIIICAENWGSETNWNYILKQCQKIHADVFAASLFDIGKKELRFDSKKACYPKKWTDLRIDGEDLLEDLLESGIFGDSTMSRKHSSNITLQAVTENKTGRKAHVSLRHSVFPERKYMERSYKYVKKYPILLPIAWIARIGNYIKEKNVSSENNISTSITIGKQRINLMRKYKIIRGMGYNK